MEGDVKGRMGMRCLKVSVLGWLDQWKRREERVREKCEKDGMGRVEKISAGEMRRYGRGIRKGKGNYGQDSTEEESGRWREVWGGCVEGDED